jgi:hypothetical protein
MLVNMDKSNLAQTTVLQSDQLQSICHPGRLKEETKGSGPLLKGPTVGGHHCLSPWHTGVLVGVGLDCAQWKEMVRQMKNAHLEKLADILNVTRCRSIPQQVVGC